MTYPTYESWEERQERERREKAKRGLIRNNLGKVMVMLILLSLTVTIVNAYAFHQSEVYPADKAVGFLAQANATNSLTGIAVYVGDANAALTNYNGNPTWPWPTADTNYSLIKQNLAMIENNSLAWNTYTPSSYAYQQAIVNTHQAIGIESNNIQNADGALGNNPFINYIGWIFAPLFILLLLAFVTCAFIGVFD